MGWSGGTEIFDDAVDVALRHCYKVEGITPRILYKSIVRELYVSDSFKYSDWDTQDESKHHEVLFEVMVELGEHEPACIICGSREVYDGVCQGDCYE